MSSKHGSRRSAPARLPATDTCRVEALVGAATSVANDGNCLHTCAVDSSASGWFSRLWRSIAGGQGTRWVFLAGGSRAGSTRLRRTFSKQGRQQYWQGLNDGSDPDLQSAPGLSDVLWQDALEKRRQERAAHPEGEHRSEHPPSDEDAFLRPYEET